MKTEQLATPAAGAPTRATIPLSAYAEADEALIDAIAFQVALHGWRPAIAVIRALCDRLEAQRG